MSRKILTSLALLLLILIIPLAAAERSESQTRIVGGGLADATWTAPVALIFDSPAPVANRQFCGGTLIHPRWVVSAAHCIRNGVNRDVSILTGTRDLRSGGQLIRVARAYHAPRIKVSPRKTIINDLALIKLRQPSLATPMPLLARELWSSEVKTGSEVETAGWGNLFEGSSGLARPMKLRSVAVEVMNTCAKAYPGDYNALVDICAGMPKGGKDSCQGDSGGPLTRTVSGTRYLIGAVSRGTGCARKGYPGVYGKVLPAMDWIEGVMGL